MKKWTDAVSMKMQEEVCNFYMTGDVSAADPSAAAKSVKTQEPLRYMENNVAMAYMLFRKETGVHISFSKFAAMRSRGMKTASKNKLRACCCEYCSNIELKCNAINGFLHGNGKQHLLFGSKFDIASTTLCSKQETEFHMKKCLDQKCRECGVHCHRHHLQEALTTLQTGSLQGRYGSRRRKPYRIVVGRM